MARALAGFIRVSRGLLSRSRNLGCRRRGVIREGLHPGDELFQLAGHLPERGAEDIIFGHGVEPGCEVAAGDSLGALRHL